MAILCLFTTWTVAFGRTLVSSPFSDLGRQSFPLSYTTTHITSLSPLISCRTQSDKQRAKTKTQFYIRFIYPSTHFWPSRPGHRRSQNHQHTKSWAYTSATQIQHFFRAHEIVAHPCQTHWPPHCQTTSPLSRARESSLAISWNWKSTRLSR